jgi:hypothetical protein
MRRKSWSARALGTKTSNTEYLAIWHMTKILLGTTTMWSHFLRPRNLRKITSRPSSASLNRRIIHTMRRVVDVPSAHLKTLFSSLFLLKQNIAK